MSLDILFLDDSPERAKKFRSHVPFAIIVAKSDEAIAQLAAHSWDYVFLDHDLGGEEHVDSSRHDCGMAVVRWIVQQKPIISHIIVHSLNSPARAQMVDALRSAGYAVSGVPYLNLYDSGIINALE